MRSEETLWGIGQGSIDRFLREWEDRAPERLMLVPGMRACLGIGSHVSGLGFRRREVLVVTRVRVLQM